MSVIEMKIGMLPKVLAALASGLLLFLSFPKYGQGPVAWIALIPLLLVLRTSTVQEGLRLGTLTGLVSQVGILYWIADVVVQYGNLPQALGLAAMLVLACYLSLYMALFSGGTRYLHQRGIPMIVAAPVLWTLLEYVRAQLLTGFPWELLAYSQYYFPTVIQISDVTGVYGVSFLIVLVNCLICDLLTCRGAGRRVLIEAFCVTAILLAVLAYGHYRSTTIEKALAQGRHIDVTLLQGNIDQNIKWSPLYQKESIDIYRSLTLAAHPSPGGLVVWPETAAPFYFQRPDDLRDRLTDIARETLTHVLFGSPSYQEGKGGIEYLNSAFLLGPDGIPRGRYDKVHLVPYGEYVPLRRLFPFIGKLVAGIGDFRAGEGFEPLKSGGHRLGVLICYEAIFPEGARDYKRRGVDLICNITNDAWFGASSAPYQHLSMTVFRAVETRLPLVRAANTGISAIVDPLGRITDQTPLFTRTSLKGRVKMIDEVTLYAAYGDLFVYGLAVLFAALLIAARKRRRKDA